MNYEQAWEAMKAANLHVLATHMKTASETIGEKINRTSKQVTYQLEMATFTARMKQFIEAHPDLPEPLRVELEYMVSEARKQRITPAVSMEEDCYQFGDDLTTLMADEIHTEEGRALWHYYQLQWEAEQQAKAELEKARRTGSAESEVHFWCEGETERQQALYTLSIGERCLCRALPLEQALTTLRAYMEEIAEETKS